MPIELDTPIGPARPPVIGARGLGQTVKAMIVNKEMRARQDRDGNPVLNPRTGRPSQEEVLTVYTLPGTTGVVNGGDLNDDWTPEPGTVCRLIFKGMQYGRLIEARQKIGATNVGDIITVTADTATIWRGAGDIAAKDVNDQPSIDRARAKGLSISWDLTITYRRATSDELDLVTICETIHNETRNTITLDRKPVWDPDDAF
jgi:hypothetical protein